jgi:hypothetical protein
MIPEGYEHGGKLTGIFTVFGFFISAGMVILENTWELLSEELQNPYKTT